MPKALWILTLAILLGACGTRGALERSPSKAPEPLLGRPATLSSDANTTKDNSR